jgi:hypothetical protein
MRRVSERLNVVIMIMVRSPTVMVTSKLLQRRWSCVCVPFLTIPLHGQACRGDENTKEEASSFVEDVDAAIGAEIS